MISNAKRAKDMLARRGINATLTDSGEQPHPDEPWKTVPGTSQQTTVKALLGQPTGAFAQGYKEPIAASLFISGDDAPAWLEKGVKVEVGNLAYTVRGILQWTLEGDSGVLELGLIS